MVDGIPYPRLSVAGYRNVAMLKLEIPEQVPLRDRAYQALKDAIVSGHLAPGERLVEAKLASELGVSRNPVREAMRRLEHDGLVQRGSRGGMVVAEIDLRDVAEVYAVRGVLEGLAARLAASRLRQEDRRVLTQSVEEGEKARQAGDLETLVHTSGTFHSTIVQAAANARLSALLHVLDSHISRFRRLSLQAEGGPVEILEEHRQLLAVLERGDGEEAERLMRIHLEHSGRQILKSFGRLARENQGRPSISAAR